MWNKTHLYLILVLVVLLAACANLGTPDGGPYDEDPPKIVGTSPRFGALNSKSKKIVLMFDENIKLDNPMEKVVISPPQINQPDIDATGKRITITLNDTLKPGITYTIDFSDAIQDNNEGNPMEDYAFTFSTGEVVDSFQVGGYVLDASNLEPMKGLLVGLYKIPADDTDVPDSIFKTKEFERVSRTDAAGHFVIKGLDQEAQYRVFALKDQDQNFMFSQKAEMLGFNRRLISPSAKPDIRQDTVWHDSIHYDSIIYKPYTHFYPDDIVLTAFVEDGQRRAFLKSERPQLEKFTIFFTAPDSALPQIKGMNFNEDNAFVLEANEGKDTLTYWIRDSLIYNNDTLKFLMTYNYTDTLNCLVERTDTMRVLSKVSYEKVQKRKKSEWEEYRKTYIKEYKQSLRRKKPADATAGGDEGENPDRLLNVPHVGAVDTSDGKKLDPQQPDSVKADTLQQAERKPVAARKSPEEAEYDEFVYDWDETKPDAADKPADTPAVAVDSLVTDTVTLVKPFDNSDKGKPSKKSKKSKKKGKKTDVSEQGNKVEDVSEEKEEKKGRKEKKNEKDEDIEIPPMPEEFLEVRVSQTSISPDQNIDFVFKEPIDTAYVDHFHFYQTIDSVDYDRPFLLRRVEGSVMQYRLYAEWEPDSTYYLRVDTGAVVSMYGNRMAGTKKTIKVKGLDRFGQLTVKFHNTDPSAIVSLLTSGGKVVKQQKMEGGKVDFFYVEPGTYYMSMFYDRNGDGKWTTGDYDSQRQPEETFFYPGEILIRALWDDTKDWDPTQTPLFKQKPEKITKQKPEKQKQKKSKNAEREEKKKNS